MQVHGQAEVIRRLGHYEEQEESRDTSYRAVSGLATRMCADTNQVKKPLKDIIDHADTVTQQAGHFSPPKFVCVVWVCSCLRASVCACV